MRPPARTISAARLMRRSCGETGCSWRNSAIHDNIRGRLLRTLRTAPHLSFPMQALTEFAPLVAFFVAYMLGGLYVATAVLMAAMLALVAWDWLRLRRVPPMHSLSAALVLIFGSATLALHNPLFIQWKPTVFFWLVSLAFLGSAWIGERTLT